MHSIYPICDELYVKWDKRCVYPIMQFFVTDIFICVG